MTASDVGPFLGRLVRLDPGAVVRLRPEPDGTVALWARVPWGVLATRDISAWNRRRLRGAPLEVPGPAPADVTVGAAAWLASLTDGDGHLPPPRDHDWRWPLPPGPGTAVESVPAETVLRLGTAAAETLRASRGRVGERILRDALLDHVPIVVPTSDGEIKIRQGMVQAVLRMGLINTDGHGRITVRIAGTWVGLGAEHGSVWLQNGPSLAIHLTG
jgi:hypothetical protein